MTSFKKFLEETTTIPVTKQEEITDSFLLEGEEISFLLEAAAGKLTVVGKGGKHRWVYLDKSGAPVAASDRFYKTVEDALGAYWNAFKTQMVFMKKFSSDEKTFVKSLMKVPGAVT